MLESIRLDRKADKATYKQSMDTFEDRLPALRRRALELGVPIIIVFEGWDAAGKGTLINELIGPLDPRGYKVHSTLEATEDESLRPFLWRFWRNIPPRGRVAIFDRSWYRRVLLERVETPLSAIETEQAFDDIRSFERQLHDAGYLIIKLFLHISKDQQKRRLEKLADDPTTAWRVTPTDRNRNKRYDDYLAAADEMIAETDAEFAPWTVVEAHDRRFASLKIFHTVETALSRRIDHLEAGPTPDEPVDRPPRGSELSDELRASILNGADLSVSLERDDYRRRLKAGQQRLRRLEHQMYLHRVPVVLVYEGWDAAGKGGNIRRLTRELDPRGYEVVPIAAPNDAERQRHYLWRFWTQMPKAGHLTIFDRSWYGRVLVERVEGFATEDQWRRAYREINEMEQHLTHYGTVLCKFWLHIDRDEQLRRFEARQGDPRKQWKITEEDWRNRENWDAYARAVEEMLLRTSTPRAPWTLVESNCKWFARVKVIETVCEAIEQALEDSD